MKIKTSLIYKYLKISCPNWRDKIFAEFPDLNGGVNTKKLGGFIPLPDGNKWHLSDGPDGLEVPLAIVLLEYNPTITTWIAQQLNHDHSITVKASNDSLRLSKPSAEEMVVSESFLLEAYRAANKEIKKELEKDFPEVFARPTIMNTDRVTITTTDGDKECGLIVNFGVYPEFAKAGLLRCGADIAIVHDAGGRDPLLVPIKIGSTLSPKMGKVLGYIRQNGLEIV